MRPRRVSRRRRALQQRRAARRRRLLRAYVAPGLLVAGCLLVATAWMLDPQPPPAVGAELVAGPAGPPASVAAADAADPAPAALQVSPTADEVALPTILEIPRLDVYIHLGELGLDERGQLEAPEVPALPGWYADGPRPGEHGPAVIAGHVDSHRGPAVFWRLPELEPGDDIVVHREDGSEATFVVDRLGRWPKSAFPTDEVYRQADGAELRLITCGGVFDEQAGRYLDNIVLFARATG